MAFTIPERKRGSAGDRLFLGLWLCPSLARVAALLPEPAVRHSANIELHAKLSVRRPSEAVVKMVGLGGPTYNDT